MISTVMEAMEGRKRDGNTRQVDRRVILDTRSVKVPSSRSLMRARKGRR